MNKKENIFTSLFLILLVGTTWYFQKDIVDYFLDVIDNVQKKEILKNTVIQPNEYKSYYKYKLDDNISTNPKSKKDIERTYYSFINSGMDTLNVVCDDMYEKCRDDVLLISDNKIFLNTLNNYVHPYNSYKYIETTISNDYFSIKSAKNYSDEMIDEINIIIDEVISKYITSNMSDRDKVKVIHDYIINNTKYDTSKQEISNLAYGALINHLATCGGYTDAMSIFLYKLNIPNFKINCDTHIWNAVMIDGKWYHLDLTWDDPINNLGKDILTYDYFLITDEELDLKKNSDHNYDKNLFVELKN